MYSSSRHQARSRSSIARPKTSLQVREAMGVVLLMATFLLVLHQQRQGIAVSAHWLLLPVALALGWLLWSRQRLGQVLKDPLLYWYGALWTGTVLSVVLQGVTVGGLYDLLGRSTYAWSFSIASAAIVYFLLGVSFRPQMTGDLGLVPLVMAVAAMAIVTAGSFSFVNYAVASRLNTSPLDHLAISDVTAIATFAFVAFSRGWRIYLVAAIGLLTLLLIQGRTAFYLASVTISFVMILARPQRILVLGAIFALFASAVVYGVVGNEGVERVFFGRGFEADRSFLFRLRSWSAALSDLGLSSLYGDINWSTVHFGYLGYYVHNWLSYLHQYGIFIFMAASGLLVVLARRASGSARSVANGLQGFEAFRLMVASYCILASLTAKAFPFQWVWFAVGLYVGAVRISDGLTPARQRLRVEGVGQQAPTDRRWT